MMFLFVCFVLFCVCMTVLFMIPPDNVKKEKDKALPTMQGLFNADRQTYGQNENFYIGINEQNKHIKLGINTSKHFRTADSYRHYNIMTRTFDYKNIISVEIIEDNATVTKTNRASQLVGAGIGGALLGGTGAIVGGLSGKKTGSTEIKNITLRVVVNDERNSVFDLPFLEKKYPIKKSSNEYTQAINSIYSWHTILTKIIENEDRIKNEQFKEDNIKDIESDQLNKEDNKEMLTEIENNKINIVDQLEKIADMKNKGLINDSEFNKLKSKLIE